MNLRALAGIGLVGLVACSQEEAAVELPSEAVVVFATYEDRAYLPALFDSFTRQTGTIVIVRHGDADAIVDDVIENDISPPADVLMTRSVRGMFRAAEEGALRPIDAAVTRRVPAALRDADGYWTAISYRRSVVVYDPEDYSPVEMDGFEVLADDESHSRLCLSSASNPENIAVIAMLIDKLGVRETETIVRRWMANLARLPVRSGDELLAAIEMGECALGIVPSELVSQADGDWAHIAPQPHAFDIDGVGIARHARNPQGALQLVGWLLEEDNQTRHSDARRSYPAVGARVGQKNVSALAWYFEEAVKLAERAQFR